MTGKRLDVEGGLLVSQVGRQWVVRMTPIAGRSAEFGRVDRRRDAHALRQALLSEIPGRNLTALFDEHCNPVNIKVARPVTLRLQAIGNAAQWVAWRQRNGVCLECGQRACASPYNGGRCTRAREADQFRGGHIPADLRRWAA